MNTPASTALHSIGYYCGRYGAGSFDEPQNSLSNIAFLLDALLAYWLWRSKCGLDRCLLLLVVVLLALIGIGSFTFHIYPRSMTLIFDLVPNQIDISAVLGYLLLRVFALGLLPAVGWVAGFVLLRQV